MVEESTTKEEPSTFTECVETIDDNEEDKLVFTRIVKST